MTSHPGAGPFSLGPPGGPRVVLMHGLTGAPSELWPLGAALASAGYRVEAPLWPGHGTSPDALVDVTAAEMIDCARRVYRGANGRPPFAVVGLSMGALLALVTSAEGVPPAGLVLLAPAMRMTGRSRVFDLLGVVPWPRRVRALVSKGQSQASSSSEPRPEGNGRLDHAARVARTASPAAPGQWDGRYQRVPLRWSRELRRLRARARKATSRIRSATLVVHGLDDATAAPSGAVGLSRRLKTAPVELQLLPGAPHVLTLGPDRGHVAAEVLRFLDALPRPEDAPRADKSA